MESAKDVNALFNNATLYFPFDGDFVDKITGMQATPLGTVSFVDGQKHRAAHVNNNSGRIQIGKSFDINDFAFSYNFYNERNVHQALIHIQPSENNANLDIYMRPDSTPQSIQVWFYPHGNFVYDIGFESGTWYNIIVVNIIVFHRNLFNFKRFNGIRNLIPQHPIIEDVNSHPLMFIAAFKSLSISMPQFSHLKILSDKVKFSFFHPHSEHVFDDG